MPKTEPEPNRQQLGFEEAVLGSFDFLRSYGFRPVERNATLVRFESRRALLAVFHGRASYEIGIEVRPKDRTVKYGLDYIVSWAGKSAWEAEGFGRGTIFQVSQRDGVQRIVAKVAELLKKYGGVFLNGDAEFYDLLDDVNRRASAEYTKQQFLEDARKQAGRAWSEKDFPRVFELYQSMTDDLTKIEAKRLAYAEKQIRLSVG